MEAVDKLSDSQDKGISETVLYVESASNFKWWVTTLRKDRGSLGLQTRKLFAVRQQCRCNV